MIYSPKLLQCKEHKFIETVERSRVCGESRRMSTYSTLVLYILLNTKIIMYAASATFPLLACSVIGSGDE